MTLRRLPRPNVARTPLQQAQAYLRAAFEAAQHDPVTFRAFIDIAIRKIAAESLRQLPRRCR